MKKMIDQAMRDADVSALLITGSGFHNPAMVYLTGGGHFTRADLIKPVHHGGTLFHHSMERDEAAKSGLSLKSYSDYPLSELLKTAGGDVIQASALRYQRMLRDCGVERGKVALYGQMDAGTSYQVFSALQRLMPQAEIIADGENVILGRAMMTKDRDEIERIRRVGQITQQVVEEIADFLSNQRSKKGMLHKTDGNPLTIGDVKRKINLLLVEYGVENPEATIFGQGRDAGIPHSTGVDAEPISLGKPIVFDIFPCETGGGYYHDLTRTWCVGFAPDAVMKLYEDVLQVYQKLEKALKVRIPFKEIQVLTCNLFEEMGHATIQTDPKTEEGYVHSIGHGVGLHIHERPFSGMTASAADILEPGCVVTLEPGLYYPSKGMGVRLENSYWITDEGKFETFVNPSMDLVLPIRGA